MGRTAENHVKQHFIYTKDKNRSKCKYCPKDYAGQVVTNLKGHLEKDHPDIFKTVIQEEEATKKRKCAPATAPDSDSKKPALNSSVGPMDKFIVQKRIPIFMDLETATEACLEMVTRNGRPFKAIDDSGFQKLVGPIFSSLGTCMNRQKIATVVSNEATKEILKLTELLKSKMVCVKLDLATRLGRSFIGVNAQYPHNGKLVLSTLAVQEMTTKHTGENIKAILLEIMSKFNIGLPQIYTATTDNGSNIVKAMELCKFALGKESDNSGDNDKTDDEIDDDSSQEIIQTEDWVDDIEPDSELEPELIDDDDDEMDFNIQVEANTTLIPVRCVAHTLQLAVQDFLKDTTVSRLILTCRKLVRKLRTTNMRYVLQSVGKRHPILDTETRWSSTHNMLESLFKLKDTCKDLVEKKILTLTSMNENSWNRIDNLLQILQSAKCATDLFQRETLTAGEFHERWTKLKLSVESLSNTHSRKFTRLLRSREQRLLSNPAILAAMYIDPRYKNLLTSTQTISARKEILRVARKLISLNENEVELAELSNISVETSEMTLQANSNEDEYENILRSADARRENVELGQTESIEFKLNAIQEELDAFEKSPRQMDRQIDIFYWWNQRPGASQVLKDAALTVLSVPVTQVSVERLFSGLHYILNDLKGSMAAETVNDVLFLRTNRLFK